jgi:hypothetical protein
MTVKSLTRSSLVNNRWYENMLVGNAPFIPVLPPYEWLETQILPSNQSTVTFSNLNSTYGGSYKHLQLRVSGRSSRGGFNSDPLILQFNSDTASGNYKYHQLAGSNSTIGSSTNPYITFAGTTLFGVAVIDILDAFSTSKNKTVRSLSGHNDGSDRTIELASMGWFNTAAINTIDIKSFTGNSWLTDSRFSLYGIRSS